MAGLPGIRLLTLEVVRGVPRSTRHVIVEGDLAATTQVGLSAGQMTPASLKFSLASGECCAAALAALGIVSGGQRALLASVDALSRDEQMTRPSTSAET